MGVLLRSVIERPNSVHENSNLLRYPLLIEELEEPTNEEVTKHLDEKCDQPM